MATTGEILNYIDTNIKSLRKLVRNLEENKVKLNFVRDELELIGTRVLKLHEWYSEDEKERVLVGKYAWTLNESEFEQFCKERFELCKESEVIRKIIPHIDSLDYNTCLEWLFNKPVIDLTKELLENFDNGVGTQTTQEYNLERRDEIVKSICSAVNLQCKKP